MYSWPDTFLVILVLTNLVLLGSSRIATYIRVAAVQGVVLGLLPMLTHLAEEPARILMLGLLGLVTIGVKGVVFPWILLRTLARANVHRELKPYVGYTTATLAGVVALAISLHIGARIPLPAVPFSQLAVSVGLFTFLVGLFLIVSRRKAITQVLGYLVLENGIYAFGIAAVAEVSVLVELGVLLDAFVAVFVMQIAIYHISQEFPSTDVDQLKDLRG